MANRSRSGHSARKLPITVRMAPAWLTRSPAGVANYVPATNAVLSEMARRGVTRDALLRTLARMGADMPQPAVEMLQASRSAARRLA